MEKIKIEIDRVAAKFIVTAILFQKEGGIVFENDTHDDEFAECYGFTRNQLKKSLDELRKQIPLNKSIRERMFEGEFKTVHELENRMAQTPGSV